VPFIFVSGTLDEEVAIESLKVGATDYVFKTKVSRIVPSVGGHFGRPERARRAEAEKALRRSESYLIEARRLSHTGSFGVELSSGRIHWSEETFRIFEIEPGTTPTRELMLQRTHPEDRALVERVVDAATRRRKEFDIEHRLLLSDGSTKHIRVVGHPLENQLDFVGAVTDVTESPARGGRAEGGAGCPPRYPGGAGSRRPRHDDGRAGSLAGPRAQAADRCRRHERQDVRTLAPE
jgi:PAS domain-containing protein